MTNDEALKKTEDWQNPWMAVKGTPDNRKVAELISRNHDAQISVGETEAYIECNQSVEKKFCWSDGELEAACEELTAILPFKVSPENFEY